MTGFTYFRVCYVYVKSSYQKLRVYVNGMVREITATVEGEGIDLKRYGGTW